MTLQFIKNWLFNKELKKVSFSKRGMSSGIGVYLQYKDEQQLEALKNIILKDKYKEEDIHFLIYANQKDPLANNKNSYCQKDVKWAGFPQSEIVNVFLKKSFNKFYYLCPRLEQHQLFILSKVNADFKTGIYSKGIENILDLTIDSPFENEIKSYTEINQTIIKLTTKNNDAK